MNQKTVSKRKNTPSDSTPNPTSHVKPSDTTKTATSNERETKRLSDTPEIANDLSNDDWKENKGRRSEVELPNELYNETLPPDTRLV